MVHVQEAHMINIYTLGMDLETNNNDDSIDNSNCQSTPSADATMMPTVTQDNINNFLDCIDETQCPNSLDFNTQSSSSPVQSPIVDLKLNSVESAILSCSSRESSLSPQTILAQHSQSCLNPSTDEIVSKH